VSHSLREAIAGLVPVTPWPTPIDDLASLVDAVQAMEFDEEDFTTASWAALQTALAGAGAVLQAPQPSPAQIQAAANAVRDAINGLQTRYGTQGLVDLIAAVAGLGLQAGDYTTTTWAAWQIALGQAQAVADTPSPSQTQVAAAIGLINTALAGLVRAAPADQGDQGGKNDQGDQDEQRDQDNALAASGTMATLTALVARTVGLNAAIYRPDTWEGVAAALARAQAVLAGQPADRAQAEAALLALTDAWLGLAPRVSEVLTDQVAGNKVVAVKAAQKTIVLVKGKSTRLAAVASTAAGGTAKVTWTSNRKSVASVTAAGKITAKRAGKAVVVASAAGGKSTRITVKVVAKTPKASKAVKVGTTKVPRTMTVGARAGITGTYSPATAIAAKIAFASSNPEVLTIDRAGNIVAKAAGKATITVKAHKKSKKYRITVRG
jgi:hypothetical protein